MGRKPIPPNEWSKATSGYFAALIASKGVSKNKVRQDLAISKGRMQTLLEGEDPWYLEDVEKFCLYFKVDFKKFLRDLESGRIKLLSAPAPSITRSTQSDFDLAANKHDGEIGTETDEGFDSP